MKVVTSMADLSSHLGQTIRVRGEARNSKAGPLLFDAEDRSVACAGPHWSDALIGRQVEAVVEVRQSSAAPDFPVASQSADGAWSQGVGGLDPGGLYAALSLPEPRGPVTLQLTVLEVAALPD